MNKFNLEPNVSVGPLVFGTQRQEIREIMKDRFDAEVDLPVFEREYYKTLNVFLEYVDEKLVSVEFVDDRENRTCEIYYQKERIWPRTKKKFFALLGNETFDDVFGVLMCRNLSLNVDWEPGEPPSLLVAQGGYCGELIDCYSLVTKVLDLKKGMDRENVRDILCFTPQISDDSRTDIYALGVYSPEVTFLTYDENDKLIKIVKKYNSGNEDTLL